MMGTFRAHLQANRSRLGDKELQLADYLLTHQTTASQLSIQALSAATGVSTATVSRFAKRLGYPGFQALRVALAQLPTSPPPLFEEISDTDSMLEMAQKIFALNAAALQTTSAALNEETLAAAVHAITVAHTVGLFGLGASNIVALDGYHKFLRTQLTLSYASDYHMQLMAMTRLAPGDCAILVSHSGTDADALALAAIAHETGVRLIVITGAANSPLAQRADVVLVALAEETQYRDEALHALIAQLSLMDTLFMLTAVKSAPATANLLARIRQTIQNTRA